jgi:hypothetical protein
MKGTLIGHCTGSQPSSLIQFPAFLNQPKDRGTGIYIGGALSLLNTAKYGDDKSKHGKNSVRLKNISILKPGVHVVECVAITKVKKINAGEVYLDYC